MSNDKNYGSINNRSNRSSSNCDSSCASDCGYVEFGGKNGRTCPTCEGTGRISEEEISSLVALIPYNDKRLKPRRTKLYVMLSIIICLVLCGIIIFFLIPRSVSVKSNKANNISVNVTFDPLPQTNINFTYPLNISNMNFFEIYVSDVGVQAYFDKVKVGSSQSENNFFVPARTKANEFQVNVTMSCLFDQNNNLGFVIDLCTNPKRHVHDVLLAIDVTLSFSFMGHTEQTTVNSYDYIDCSLAKYYLSDPMSKRT